jgi:flagellar biogenesis protein FliO
VNYPAFLPVSERVAHTSETSSADLLKWAFLFALALGALVTFVLAIWLLVRAVRRRGSATAP